MTLDDLVDALCEEHSDLSGRAGTPFEHPLPSREAIAALVEDLRAALFPGYFGGADFVATNVKPYVRARLEAATHALATQIRRGLALVCEHPEAKGGRCTACDARAFEASQALVRELPRLRRILDADVRAAFDGDPAARFRDEALFCYPGVAAIIQHRIAHALHLLEIPLLPRIMSELAHAATGIDIHPGAVIGSSFFIDHGTGVVIGETCLVGSRVRIYQGVTLGARGFPADGEGGLVKGQPRHPVVEDDVVIYAGATILGRVTIGRGSIVGGNVWLTSDVPPGCQVSQGAPRPQYASSGAGI